MTTECGQVFVQGFVKVDGIGTVIDSSLANNPVNLGDGACAYVLEHGPYNGTESVEYRFASYHPVYGWNFYPGPSPLVWADE